MCSGKRTTSAIADPHSQRRRASHYARTTRSGKLKNQNEKRQHFVYTLPLTSPPFSPGKIKLLHVPTNPIRAGAANGASNPLAGARARCQSIGHWILSRLCLCHCRQLFFIKRLSKVSLGGRVEKWANRKGSNETLMSY